MRVLSVGFHRLNLDLLERAELKLDADDNVCLDLYFAGSSVRLVDRAEIDKVLFVLERMEVRYE